MAMTPTPKLNLETLGAAASEVIQLLKGYGPHVGSREMLLDPILFGFLSGRFRHMKRQHHINGPSSRPKRIDYRYGTYNPVVIEFAVRPPKGGSQLYGSQNRAELDKLIQVPASKARYRVLLLIDLHRKPLQQNALEANYSKVGKPASSATVSVLYVHRSASYDFSW